MIGREESYKRVYGGSHDGFGVLGRGYGGEKISEKRNDL